MTSKAIVSAIIRARELIDSQEIPMEGRIARVCVCGEFVNIDLDELITGGTGVVHGFSIMESTPEQLDRFNPKPRHDYWNQCRRW